MQFLVKRCPRNQAIFVIAGLLIAAALLFTFARILQTMAPRTPVQTVSVEQLEAEAVEKRKRDITRYLAAKYRQAVADVRSYVDLAWDEAAKHPDVTPEMALAIMMKESSLIPTAKSGYGAEGLMQVVRRMHGEKLAETESLMDPRVNVRVGTQILQQYIKSKGQVELALVKYSGNARGYADFVMRETAILQAI